jgi:hypothetical protein
VVAHYSVDHELDFFQGVCFIGHERFKEGDVFGGSIFDGSVSDIFLGFEVEVQIPAFNSGLGADVVNARLGVTLFSEEPSCGIYNFAFCNFTFGCHYTYSSFGKLTSQSILDLTAYLRQFFLNSRFLTIRIDVPHGNAQNIDSGTTLDGHNANSIAYWRIQIFLLRRRPG